MFKYVNRNVTQNWNFLEYKLLRLNKHVVSFISPDF